MTSDPACWSRLWMSSRGFEGSSFELWSVQVCIKECRNVKSPAESMIETTTWRAEPIVSAGSPLPPYYPLAPEAQRQREGFLAGETLALPSWICLDLDGAYSFYLNSSRVHNSASSFVKDRGFAAIRHGGAASPNMSQRFFTSHKLLGWWWWPATVGSLEVNWVCGTSQQCANRSGVSSHGRAQVSPEGGRSLYLFSASLGPLKNLVVEEQLPM